MTGPSQEEWDKAFEQSHECEPSAVSWGLFAYSDAPPPVCGSGCGSFHWFATKEAMLEFVQDYMAWWNPAPSSMEPEDIAKMVQEIVAAEDDTERLRGKLNHVMLNMWQIEWWGTYEELRTETSAFALKVRETFEELSDAEDFSEFLRQYGF
jgi:hypothetical protein